MLELIFEDVGGVAVPLLPTRSDGSPVHPDGTKVFDLESASAHFKLPVGTLRQIWTTAWGAIIDSSDEGVLEKSSPAATPAPSPMSDAAEALRQRRFEILRRVEYPQL